MKYSVLFLLLLTVPVSVHADDVPYLRCFELASERHGVSLPLLLGVARTESNFDPDARSPAGAHGIMQVRWPLTARHLGVRRVSELYNPCVNIDVGASYLKELLARYNHDVELSLAAYNYGPTRLRSRSDIPASVQSYVNKVLMPSGITSANTNPGPSQGDLELNRFKSQSLAMGYIASIKRLVPSASIRIDAVKTNYHVILTGGQLSRLDRLRLSRIFNLESLQSW